MLWQCRFQLDYDLGSYTSHSLSLAGGSFILELWCHGCKHPSAPTGNIPHLTDNLTLSRAVNTRNINADAIRWEIRPSIADFFNISNQTNCSVFHLPRPMNEQAHKYAHQTLSNSTIAIFNCSNPGHTHRPYHYIQSLKNANLHGYFIHVVLCG